MLQFVCDYCSNVKQPSDVWITGVAAENVGTQAARREVVIDRVWTYDRAVLPFAVHFCSQECKERYLATLFDRPSDLLEIDEVSAVPGVGRVVKARKRPAVAPRTSKATRSAAASRRAKTTASAKKRKK